MSSSLSNNNNDSTTTASVPPLVATSAYDVFARVDQLVAKSSSTEGHPLRKSDGAAAWQQFLRQKNRSTDSSDPQDSATAVATDAAVDIDAAGTRKRETRRVPVVVDNNNDDDPSCPPCTNNSTNHYNNTDTAAAAAAATTTTTSSSILIESKKKSRCRKRKKETEASSSSTTAQMTMIDTPHHPLQQVAAALQRHREKTNTPWLSRIIHPPPQLPQPLQSTDRQPPQKVPVGGGVGGVGVGGGVAEEDEVRANGWEAAHDPTTGKIYYYCRSTGERSWEKPATTATPFTTTTTNPTTNPIPTTLTRTLLLPAGWTAVSDAATGREYYYHTASRETTWTRPDSNE